MTADIYTAIAEELARVGGIDAVGVVNAPGKTAILFAGTKVKQKYIAYFSDLGHGNEREAAGACEEAHGDN